MLAKEQNVLPVIWTKLTILVQDLISNKSSISERDLTIIYSDNIVVDLFMRPKDFMASESYWKFLGGESSLVLCKHFLFMNKIK